ncbi:MAG: hypothetical protein JNK64_01055 [Myxococcales bacterium]|nr:hypothetical protein [Myxococcales bacterium]
MKVAVVVLIAAVGLGIGCGSRGGANPAQRQAERERDAARAERDAARAERDAALRDLHKADALLRELADNLAAEQDRASALRSLRDQMTAAHRDFLAARTDAERRQLADQQARLWGFDIDEARRPPPRRPNCPIDNPLC